MPCALPAHPITPYVGCRWLQPGTVLAAAGYSLAPVLAVAGYSLAPVLAATGYSLAPVLLSLIHI